MNTFFFCFVLAVGLAGQAAIVASNQQSQAPSNQVKQPDSLEVVKKAFDDLEKKITTMKDNLLKSTETPVNKTTELWNDMVGEHRKIFDLETQTKMKKVLDDLTNIGSQNASTTASDFQNAFQLVVSNLRVAVEKHEKDIPSASKIVENFNNFVNQIVEPKRN